MKLSLGKKAACVIVLLALALTAAAAVTSYRVYAENMNSHYEMLAQDVTDTAAAVLDAQQVKIYADAVKEIYLKNPGPIFSDPSAEEAYWEQYEALQDEGYETLFLMLEKIKLANQVQSLYIVYMDPESMTCVYIVDADRSEDACPAGTWDLIYSQNYEAMQHPEDGFPAYITNTDYGWLCSAGAAILDSDGSVIAHAMVDISMDSVMADRRAYLVQLCIVLGTVTVLMTFILIYLINRVLVQPINKLSSAASSYVTGKKEGTASKLQQIQIKTGDELEHLADTLKAMEGDIDRYMDDLTAVTAEKERIGAELDVARNIQASILPNIFPAFPGRPEFDIYATMTPAKEVGGDFYDFFLVDRDHLAMVMADVSGKGVPAAMFMMISKTLIKNSALLGLSPKEVLEKVNNQLCDGNEEQMFVTAWLGILEISTGKLVCVNAGHEYPAVRKADGSFDLFKDKHGFVLAGMENAHYKEYVMELRPGDELYVYTDGVAEATDANTELYGTERMLRALNRLKDCSCEELLEGMKRDIDAFVGEAPQFDDITMLCIRMNNYAVKTFPAVPESAGDVATFVETWLEKNDTPMKLTAKLMVAVDEIYCNIASYSGASEASVEVSRTDTQISITFADDGTEYNPLEKEDPDTTLSAEERKVGGLGVFIVKKTMDETSYQWQDGKNIFTMRLNLPAKVAVS